MRNLRNFLIVLALFFCDSILAQQLSKVTPFYNRDSITIHGKVIDDFGNPIENAYVLFSPFRVKKYDITWYEKDSTVSDMNGNFTVKCTKSQILSNRLYFKKNGYFTTAHFLHEDSGYISIDTAIVLHDRQKHWFATSKINQEVLGMTVTQVLSLLKLDVSQSELIEMRNSDNVHAKALRIEAADSSMILLIVRGYSDSLINKIAIMSNEIVGIGIAFTNGEKRFFGDAILYKRRVYNEYRENEGD
jgi:hypothetical protein